MNTPLRIGIVLNYKKAEKKKDELLNVNSTKMKWLALAKNKEYRNYVITSNNKIKVPCDVAIGLYIETHYSNVEVDYIQPHEISTNRFKRNNINFIFIYDLLEAFHLSKGNIYVKFKNALKKSGNVYPPYEYQKFINNKCSYYKYLSKKGIPVAPTYCITNKKWYKRDPKKYVNRLINKVKNNKWESLITKPIYGQESIGFAKFVSCKPVSKNTKNTKNTGNSLDCRKKQILKYLSKNIPKYRGFILQEYIPGFDKNNPEYRTFFVNGVYSYTIVTHSRTNGIQPVQEGGPFKLSNKEYSYLRKLSQRVMNSLPKFDLPGKLKKPILTRIDIGTGLEGVPYEMFINEVEFVPSLYIEEIDLEKYPILENIGKTLVKVGEEYSMTKGVTDTIF